MSQHYSDPSHAADKWSLPDLEVFQLTAEECAERDEDLCHLDDSRELDKDTAEAIREAFIAFADWIYRSLESEYNYQNADEQVDDTIRANEYEFHADGTRSRF